MQNVKVGIIGTGGISRQHAREYKAVGGVTIAACCDINKEAAAKFAEEWDVKTVFSDYREMLREGGLDAVSVTTPDASHAEVSIAALQAGIPVICEKPMAVTLEDAGRMVQAARESGLPNMINYSKRDFSGLQGARTYIAEGKIGRVMHMEASYMQGWLAGPAGGQFKDQPKRLWRLSTGHGSSGTLGDLGCHIYDASALLCGPIRSIFCKLAVYDKGFPHNRIGEYLMDANDSMAASVIFRSGALGMIHSTRWAAGYANREFLRVYGDAGSLEFDADQGRDCFFVRTPDQTDWTKIETAQTPSNIARFIDWVKNGTKAESDFENGWMVQAYLDSSVKSDQQGTAIDVPVQIGGNT